MTIAHLDRTVALRSALVHSYNDFLCQLHVFPTQTIFTGHTKVQSHEDSREYLTISSDPLPTWTPAPDLRCGVCILSTA
jgi:hypothetical protein